MAGFRPGLFFFGLLYLLQGAILAYISNFQKSFLVNHHVEPRQIGALTSAMLLPFILKIFLGALSDRVRIGSLGRRKPYLIIGLLLCVACYCTLRTVDPGTSYFVFLILSVTSTLGLALFDTTADGLALDASEPSEESAIQTAMMTGKSLGYILFSFAFGIVVSRAGVSEVFVILAVLAALVMAVCLFVQEPPAKVAEKEQGYPWAKLFNIPFFLLCVFGITHCVTSFGVDGLVTLFLNKGLGHNLETIGHYGSSRGFGAVLGAILSLVLLKKAGMRNAIFTSVLILAAGVLLVAYWEKNWPVAMLGICWGLAWGLLETVFLTVAMHVSRGAWSATCFAVLAMMCNVGTAIGEGVAPSLAYGVGYRTAFLYAAAWVVILPLLTGFLYFRTAERSNSPTE